MLQYVPIVIILVIVYLFKKKTNKQTKKEKDPYFGMGKIPKLCHNTPLSIFSLGKGRESLRLKTLHKKKLITSALSDLPPARNDLDKASMPHVKIAQYMYIFP